MADTIVTEEDAARFWAKTRRDDVTGCLRWTAGCCSDGYGTFRLHGRVVGAHRVAWMIAHGSIPTGRCVLHSCDTPPCVESAHLFLGTQVENIADMDKKGRRGTACGDKSGPRLHPDRLARGDRSGARLHPERMARGDRNGSRLHPERLERGEENHNAKLTEDDVRAIRGLVGKGLSQGEIGQLFGVNQQSVSNIIRRVTWRHVPW